MLGKAVFGMFLSMVYLLLCGHRAAGDVLIINNDNETEKEFIDYELPFTAAISAGGIQGYLQVAEPADACLPIKEPPFATNSSLKWFVLIERYPCSFEEKVRNAQFAGYHAAIVYNVGLNNPEPTARGSNSGYTPFEYIGRTRKMSGADVEIPGILVGQDDGRKMKNEYTFNKGYTVVINPDSPFNLNTYLMPFAIVIGFCFVIMLLFMIVKCIKDRRRSRRNRLSSRHLKHLPTTKYKKGDKYEVCAVCLDDYCEGEKLRILPCSHAYHTKCIDPWLTNNRRNCPICKRKVAIPGVTPDSDSESEAEQDASETTPLLLSTSNGNTQGNRQSAPTRTNGGTFSSSSSASSASSRGSSSAVEARGSSYRPLSDQEAGPSSRSDSYQEETQVQMHSPMTSSLPHSTGSSNSDEDIYHSSNQMLLAPDDRHSINADEDFETPIVVVAESDNKSSKKSRTELVV